VNERTRDIGTVLWLGWGLRARGRSDTVGTFLASAICRCGTYLIPQGPQRANGGVERAGQSPRLGGPEEDKRSARSPRGGAWRRSAGMRPEHVLRVQR
jgi:hypothetical protein